MSTDTRQEPLDTINAEITDAFEDLGGPSISETAQGRDHYTRQGQLDRTHCGVRTEWLRPLCCTGSIEIAEKISGLLRHALPPA